MSIFYCYARVSTQSQDQISPDTQAERLIKDAERLGMEYVVIKEVGSGESMFGRPKFMNMLSNLKENDVVGVWDQSRLSRSDEESFIIINRITEAKAKLMVNSKFLNIEDPQDRAIFGINSVFASYSRRLQLQKSKEGMKQKFSNGDAVFKGNLLGWTLNKYGQATINQDEAEVIRYIFDSFIKGKGLKELERELWGKTLQRPFKFSKESLRYILMRPLYMSYYLNLTTESRHIFRFTEDEIKENLVKSNIYPQIVTEETWWKAFHTYRNVRVPHATEYANRYTIHTLSGVYKCPCGKGISYHHRMRNGKKFEVYMWQEHTPSCPIKKHTGYDKEWLEKVTQICFLLTFLQGNEIGLFFKEKREELERLTGDIDNELKEIDKQMNKELTKRDRLVDAVAEGLFDNATISRQLGKIKDVLDDLEHRRNKLLQQKHLKMADYDVYLEVSSQDVLDNYYNDFRGYLLKYTGHCLLQSDTSLTLEFINGKSFHILRPKRTNKETFPSMVDVSFRGEEQYSFEYHKGQITRMVTDNEYLQPVLDKWMKITNGELRQEKAILLS